MEKDMRNGKIPNTRIRFPGMNIKNYAEYCAVRDINDFLLMERLNRAENWKFIIENGVTG